MDIKVRSHVLVLATVAALLFLQLPGCACPYGSTRERSAVPGNPAAAGKDNPLADTRWRLVAIQSMDDTVGTTRPEDPSRFTMELKGDGTVTMRLDCNRASGTWSAEPAAGGGNGTFQFGPLAATRALCPPPNLDERISAQSAYVRGYVLKEGRLYLSLLADGGILEWEEVKE